MIQIVSVIKKRSKKMNENINLCEILKGHEGEIFYSPISGNIKLHHIQLGQDYPIIFLDEDDDFVSYTKGGKPYLYAKECLIFPSKDQRDWNKWDKENNHKTPKTWSEYVDSEHYEWNEVIGHLSTKEESIYKSMFALFKIHQLIEVGYGGNVSNEEWCDDTVPKWIIIRRAEDTSEVVCVRNLMRKSHIAFHTMEQAREFALHRENVQLIKDYYMV